MKTKSEKITKRILSVILCFSLIIAYIPLISVPVSAADDITVTIDTGTSVTLKDSDGDNYYEIGTSDALFAFAAAVNDGNSTINAELTADVAVYENLIVDDSYNSNVGSAAGARKPEITAEYNGTFDGQNYTISGLLFYNVRKSLALFHNIGSNGTVKNLQIADSYHVGLSSVGIAIKNYGTITNCYINDDVVIGGTSGALSSGIADVNYGVISNCNNTARCVKASAKSAVAGIVGNNYGYVINCCNTGTFNSGDATWGYFGGIAYYNYNVIANSYIFYDGLINVSDFGGIVYRNEEDGIITNSYTFGMNSPVADFYNSVVRKNEGTVDSLSGEKSLSQFASGEVSYLLQQGATVEVDGTSTFYDGNIWGQDIDNGKTVQSYPTFTGDDVNYGYTCATGVDEKIYTNNNVSQNEKPGHSIENGICINCGYECEHSYVNGICELNNCYASATLNAEGFYEVKNAGNLFWFAQQVNEVGNREIKGVLTDDIDLENRP